ncbi:MAG: NAD(P)/FAD-dependent oxidoreductase [Candidatus Omnitrophica bacterium]|nr:NAD(P)/FAD-dependent oxidoreductase [Candidatus Omnitrophota bacterium]
MDQVDITVVGAGIIGLAISAAVSRAGRSVYALEKNSAFGQESSSRNSEVIHAGIYYPQNSLKALTCVEGNRMIYQVCDQNNIACKRLGKLVVACQKQEIAELTRLLQQGRLNGVTGLRMLSQQEISSLEPRINVLAAMFSPNTGIVDSHNLMRYFFQKAKGQGCEFSFQTEVIEIKKQDSGFSVSVVDADGSTFSFTTRILINCSGLNSDHLAQLAGIDIEQAGYNLKFCKGEYFRVSGSKSHLINHLVYPVPENQHHSLGIHATPDLGGGLRLGPDARYIQKDEANYDVDDSQKEIFAQSVNKFLPFIESNDLLADTAGIRPKLQGPKNSFRDFVICDEKERGLPGLINLIGIDSPGLTAAPAIAKRVQGLVEDIV